MPVTPHPNFARFFVDLHVPPAGLIVPWQGFVVRGATPRWMSEPYRLTGTGSLLSGGRWSVRRLMPAIYFSTDAITQAREFHGDAAAFGFAAQHLKTQTVATFTLTLARVLDLTNTLTRRVLGVEKRELLDCRWAHAQRRSREPITQALGRAAFEAGIEGMIVPSVRQRGGKNVVVFPARLRPGSSVTADDPKAIPFVHGL